MEKSLIFHFDCYLLLLESSGGANLKIGLGGFWLLVLYWSNRINFWKINIIAYLEKDSFLKGKTLVSSWTSSNSRIKILRYRIYQRHYSISEDDKENVNSISVLLSLYKLLIQVLALTRMLYNEICRTCCSAVFPLPRSITVHFSWKDMPNTEMSLGVWKQIFWLAMALKCVSIDFIKTGILPELLNKHFGIWSFIIKYLPKFQSTSKKAELRS